MGQSRYCPSFHLLPYFVNARSDCANLMATSLLTDVISTKTMCQPKLRICYFGKKLKYDIEKPEIVNTFTINNLIKC